MAFTAAHPFLRRKSPRRRRKCSNTPIAALGRVLVVGANRGLGLEVSRSLRAHGAKHVTGTSRPGRDTHALSSAADEVVCLDVHDRDAVSDTIATTNADIIISCVGGDFDTDTATESALLAGNRNLIDAAQQHRTSRFVLVSALGAGDSEGEVPMQVYFTMRRMLVDKTLAERHLRESSLQWTIARPGPLVEEESTGAAVLTEGSKCYGTITRPDLAEMLVRAADSDKGIGKTLAVVDRTRILLTSPYVRPLEFWEGLPFEEFKL